MDAYIKNYSDGNQIKVFRYEERMYLEFEDLQYNHLRDDEFVYDEDDDKRTISVNSDELFRNFKAISNVKTLSFDVKVISDSFNSYPKDVVHISFDQDKEKFNFKIDNCILLFDEEELSELLITLN